VILIRNRNNKRNVKVFYTQTMQPTFPTTYSTLSPAALGRLLSQKYNLRDIACRLLVRGVGDTYLAEASNRKFILRVYRSGIRSFSQIRAEVDLLLTLHLQDVSVSYPVADREGGYIQTLSAAEGERHAVLFSYAQGCTVCRLSEAQLKLLGKEMARFHNVSSGLVLSGERWTFDAENTLTRPLQMVKSFFIYDREGYAWLMEAARRVKEKLGRINTTAFSSGYVHFDLLPKNFYFENEEKITLFDFDFFGYGWLIYDLMTFRQHLLLDVHFGRMTYRGAEEAYSVFVDAYKNVRYLSKEEQEAIPLLGLGFWLFYLGFYTTHDGFHQHLEAGPLKMRTDLIRQLTQKYGGLG
jgi:Ser/Thr protein kinase RdoA (MazF antagonist)